MESSVIRCLLAISIYFVECLQAGLFTMLSHDQQYLVDKGAELSLSCVFYKDNFNLFDNPIQWKKNQHGEVSEINILGNIKEPFDSTGRFEVTFDPLPPRYTMGLNIKNVSNHDNANYTCEVRAPKTSEMIVITYTVYIKDPVQSLYVGQDNSSFTIQKTNLTSVTFIDDQPTSVRCVALGGSPPPEMRVYLGADDYTKYFRYDVISLISGPVGFRTLRMTSILASDDIRVSVNDDGKRLNCVAKVPGFNKAVSSVKVIVNYAPVIQCYTASAHVGDRNVRLLCDVTAKPELTSWFWKLGENGTTISEGEVIDGYWTVVTKTDTTHHLELYIRETSRQSFRIYTLIVANEIAMETRQVALRRLYRHLGAEGVSRHQKHGDMSTSRKPTSLFSSSSRQTMATSVLLLVSITVLAL